MAFDGRNGRFTEEGGNDSRRTWREAGDSRQPQLNTTELRDSGALRWCPAGIAIQDPDLGSTPVSFV